MEILITKLDGKERECEFKGIIEIKVNGRPDHWTSVDSVIDALNWYSKEKPTPLTRSIKTVPQFPL